MTTKRKTSSMPTKKAILSYWREKNPNMFFKNLDWSIHDDNEHDDQVNFMGKNVDDVFCCFACGYSKTIERAHIVAVSSGGSDDVSNIHLLCKSCHLQTESMVINGDSITRAIYDEFIMSKSHYRQSIEEARMKAIEYKVANTPKEVLALEIYNMLVGMGVSDDRAKKLSLLEE